MGLIKKQYDLTEGNIWKKLVLFFLPILGGSLFQQLYTTVDADIIGQFAGKDALASIDAIQSDKVTRKFLCRTFYRGNYHHLPIFGREGRRKTVYGGTYGGRLRLFRRFNSFHSRYLVSAGLSAPIESSGGNL